MEWKLEVISPIHIGTGEQLSQFDYAFDSPNQSLIIIDFDKALERPEVDVNELSRAMRNRDFRMDEFLAERKVHLGDVEKYCLPCKIEPAATGLRVQMKDVYGNPYIPGSSIKGAIRTAFFWKLLGEDDEKFFFAERYLDLVIDAEEIHEILRQRNGFASQSEHRAVISDMYGSEEAPEMLRVLYNLLGVNSGRLGNRREERKFRRGLENLGKSRERLDDAIEKNIFGKDPNVDIFRSIQVSDSKSINPKDWLEAGLIWTYTLDGQSKLNPKIEGNTEYKVFVEQLKPDAATDLTIKIDEYLFGRDCAELGFQNRQRDIQQFAIVCNQFSQQLINSELEFYTEHGLDDIAEFYEQLEGEVDLDSNNEFLLCIGWGGGYEAKTVGALFKDNEGFFNALRERYRLGRSRSAGGYHPIFPKTRRLTTEYGIPIYPLGWVKLACHAV